jgi:predicted nucleic acid-binding protein
MVEMYSALARRKREGAVPPAYCDVAAHAFTVHSTTDYEFIELDLGIVERSRQLLDRYPLRAYDAVQLASALVANQALGSAGLTALIFLSADDHLNKMATAEGLAVDDPNAHS